MFAIGFFSAIISYMHIFFGYNTPEESLIAFNAYNWTAIPILIAIIIAANDRFFKIKRFDKTFYIFAGLTFLCFILAWLPIDVVSVLGHLRQIIGIEVIIVSLYWFIKSHDTSYLKFLCALVCFTVAGISMANNILHLPIILYLMAHIFLATIFITGTKKGVSSYFSIKSELKDVQEKLQESEKRYKKLFDSSPDAMMMLAENGTISFVNNVMAKGFNISADELTNKNIHDILPKKIDEERTKIAKKALITGKVLEYEDERNGKQFHNSFIPIISSDGKKYIHVIARNITHQKQIEQEMKNKVMDLRNSELATLNIMEDMQETVENLEKAKIRQAR